jgi:plastocyanin
MTTPAIKLYAIVFVSFTLITAGCKKNGTSSMSPALTYSRIDPATSGAIEGVIHFDKPAPNRIEIDMAQDPACAMGGGSNMSEEYVVNDGKLANVFVYITSGLGDKAYAPSGTPVVLDQKGCRYVPHVIGVQVGQPVEFRNSDPTMHNIHMEPQVGGNQAIDISQAPNGGANSGSVRRVFAKPETMIPVRCNNHPWMQAYINVAANPFFAVSDESGHYSINGLAPGVYTLTAVQEQLGTKQATVTVTSHGVTESDLHFGTQ